MKYFIPLWGQQHSSADILILRDDETFIPLWGQQLPYQSSLVPGTPEIFHTPTGTATILGFFASTSKWKHFLPLWGQQQSRGKFSLIGFKKHFIPLWGQQLADEHLQFVICVETFHTPMGTATRLRESLSRTFRETFHTPMGTATQALNAPLHFLRRKHFIPLWGQQPGCGCSS